MEYQPLGFDPREKVRELQALRAKARGDNAVELLMRGLCDQAVLICRLLAARGGMPPARGILPGCPPRACLGSELLLRAKEGDK